MFVKLLSNRYLLTPQFKSYENLKNEWKPFVMYFHEKNYKSDHVCTDEYGFRYTQIDGIKYSINASSENFHDVSIIVGGSTVFGVGSTSDCKTISSIMSDISGMPYLNFGGRAYGCNQELILFTQFAHKFKNIKEVILFSGLNEIYLSRPILGGDIFGNFFFGSKYKLGMDTINLSLMRKIYNSIFNTKIKDNVSYPNVFDVDFAISQIDKTLYIWKILSNSLKFNLKFVLQPSPDWCKKPLTQEEFCLFAELDNFDNHKLISKLNFDLYKTYSKKLKFTCQKHSINFYDSNILLGLKDNKTDWIFADRAHTTDLGNIHISNLLFSLQK